MWKSLEEVPEHVQKVFMLTLNPMHCRVEARELVGVSESRKELDDLLTTEKVEPYRNGQWHKQYRQGGPLEWFNPPDESFGPCGVLELKATMERVWSRA